MSDAESGFGSIFQIFESLQKSQINDMSDIRTELCKLSLELCQVRECQGKILHILSSDTCDRPKHRRDKKRSAEPERSSEIETADNDLLKPTPEQKLKQLRVPSSESSKPCEAQDPPKNVNVLEDCSMTPSGETKMNVFGERTEASIPIPQVLPLAEAAAGNEQAPFTLRSDVCFVEYEPNSREQSKNKQPNTSSPAAPEKKSSSRIRLLGSKSTRLFFPQPHAAAVKFSAQTLFDDRMPHHRTVRKRILSCYGACGESSTTNALWRKFLLAVFGIQDDEVWTGKVGSAVIHPDSRFSRGEERESES